MYKTLKELLWFFITSISIGFILFIIVTYTSGMLTFSLIMLNIIFLLFIKFIKIKGISNGRFL